MELTAIDLFGTVEPPPKRCTLRAGPLSAVLEAGQLRDLRFHDVEVVRGIAYLLRDAAWGTLPVTLSRLEIREGTGAFVVTYAGRADSAAGCLDYLACIEGQAGGTLSFEVTATAGTDFLTNRTGIVLLHPDNLAGHPLRIGHSDGSVEAMSFPRLISPDQPAFDILSLEHVPVPGVRANVTFEGGIWEMEDQRNWSDASFKTYVRPLAWPFPYVIPAGATERQRVVLRLSGRPEAAGSGSGDSRAAGRSTVPPVHLRLAEGEPLPKSLPLPGLARGLIQRIRPGTSRPGQVAAAAVFAEREGMSLAVEAIFAQREPEAEAAACVEMLGEQRIDAFLVAAARDLRTRPSNSLPEGEAPIETTVEALRRAGFAGRIGTGVPTFFTEFNRNPPPPADFAFFGICPLVHAADDCSVMETLQVLPAILESAARLVPGAGLWPGPLAIAPAVNPYGPGLAETDGASRICLAGSDPRHGVLFGAAHLLAAMAATLPWAEALVPLHVNGPSGVAGPDGGPYPLAFVVAEVAQAEGAALAEGPAAPRLASIAWDRAGRRTILLANTGPEATDLPWPLGVERAEILAPGSQGWMPFDAAGLSLRVEPYRTLRLGGRTGTA